MVISRETVPENRTVPVIALVQIGKGMWGLALSTES